MTWKRILKTPPIGPPEGPTLNTTNDNLTDSLIERLFEEVIDPKIESTDSDSDFAFILLSDLKMSPEFALEKAKQFYGDFGYKWIELYPSGDKPQRLYFKW
jgi:hypothetical protein